MNPFEKAWRAVIGATPRGRLGNNLIEQVIASKFWVLKPQEAKGGGE